MTISKRCPRHCHMFLIEIRENSSLAEATNEYLAKYFEVCERTIQRWIKTLQENKLIVCEYISKIKRKITSVFSKTTTSTSSDSEATPYNIYVYNTANPVDNLNVVTNEPVVECIFNKMRGFGISRQVSDDVIAKSPLSHDAIDKCLDYFVEQMQTDRWKNLRSPSGYIIYSILNGIEQSKEDKKSTKVNKKSTKVNKGKEMKVSDAENLSSAQLKAALKAERAHTAAQYEKVASQAREFEKWRDGLSIGECDSIIGDKAYMSSLVLKDYFFTNVFNK